MSVSLEELEAELARRTAEGPSVGDIDTELRNRGIDPQASPAQVRRQQDERGRLQQIGEQANMVISSTFGMPVDAVNSVLGLFGLGSAEPVLGSRSIQRAFRFAGAGSREATDPLARGVGIALGSLPLGLVGQAASAGGVGTLATSQGLKTALAREAAPTIGSALGITTAATVAPDSVGAEMIGSIAGGLAPALARGTPGIVRGMRGFGSQNQQRFSSNYQRIIRELDLDPDTPITPSVVANTPGAGVGEVAQRASGVERLFGTAPMGAAPIRRATERFLSRQSERLRGILDRGRQQAERGLGIDPLTDQAKAATRAGRLITQGVNEFLDDFKQRNTLLWDGLNDRLGRFSTRPTNTTGYLAGQQVSAAGGRSATAMTRGQRPLANVPARVRRATQGFFEDLRASNGEASYDMLHTLRRTVGDYLGDKHLIGTGPTNVLKRYYAAITRDMEAIADAADHSQAFARANRFTNAGHARIDEVLSDIAKKGASPDRIFRLLETGRTVADGVNLARIRSSVGADRWRIIANQVLRRMGIATKANTVTGEIDEAFDLVEWGRNFRSLSVRNPSGMRVLLGEGIDAKAIRRLGDAMGEIAETRTPFGNPSAASGAMLGPAVFMGGGTAAAGAIAGAAGAGATGIGGVALAGLGLSLLAANQGSRLLTNPRFIRWLGKATTVNTGNMPAHIARLNAVAATADPETQDEMMDFLDMFGRLMSGNQEEQ